MRLGERVVDFEGLERGGLGFWHRLIRRHVAPCLLGSQKIVSVSKAAVGKREVRIFFNRLLKILKRLLHPMLGPLAPVKASLQIELISLIIYGVMLGKTCRISIRKFQPQFLNYLVYDLALRRQ